MVGLAVRGDSSVVVGDAANAQVVHIAPDGHVIARAGRKGSLVGEYQRLQWVGMCDDSALYVHDVALSRISLLGDKLQAVRTRSVPKSFDSRDIAGCLSGAQLLILNDSNQYTVAGVFRRPLSLVRFDAVSGRADTLRKFAGAQVNFVRRLGTAIGVPMGARTHVAVHGSHVLVAESDRDSLWRYDGKAWRGLALENLPAAQASTAADDKRARLALGWAPRTPQDRAFAPALLAETQTSRVAPRIDGLVASSDGTAWVALKPDGNAQREWINYDAKGKQTGRTRFAWTFEPREVRGATWWGVERDSIGVETVVRYRVGAKN
ncbi:MAG: hypothetical protein H7Z40_05425 [Phycisphaerae bacterium]|nr:hypothetical protein [Gemmatimonadaceae bacterium]